MATTPTYGWETPDDTDLVKDGAAAIRTLGNAIDTTMGTMVAKTIVDAKGDIIAATAADTVSKLTVGANDTVLTADSTTATGLKWATAGASFVGCQLKLVSTQNIATSTFTALNFNAGSEVIDTNAFHDTTTNNSRITIPTGRGGKYAVNATAMWPWSATAGTRVRIYLNGAVYSESRLYANTLTDPSVSQYQIMNLVAGDYLEAFVIQTTGSAQDIFGTTTYGHITTSFGVQFLGA